MADTNSITTKKCSCCKLYKDADAFVKDRSVKSGLYVYCKSCVRGKAKNYRLANAEKLKQRARDAYIANRDDRLLKQRAKSPESKREASRKWLESNREIQYERNKRWAAKNPGVVRAYSKNRETKKKRAMPIWADKMAIAAIYQECHRISKETQIKHHVDHYYPLAGKTVCGLHVADNLRIVPAAVNLSKGNSFPE